jgi:hypothetical protein
MRYSGQCRSSESDRLSIASIRRERQSTASARGDRLSIDSIRRDRQPTASIRRDRQSRGDKLVSQIVVSAVAVKQSMILTDPADSVGDRNLVDRLEFTSNMKPSFSKLRRL